MINNDIEVTIVEIKGGTVKIGITAPRSVLVYRKEIYEEILKENLSAAVSQKEAVLKISSLLSSKLRAARTQTGEDSERRDPE